MTDAVIHPPVPTTKDDLLIAALRCANDMGGTLNDIAAEVYRLVESEDDHRYDRLHELLLRRFNVNSAVHLFIAADNLRLDLPEDLRGEIDTEAMED